MNKKHIGIMAGILVISVCISFFLGKQAAAKNFEKNENETISSTSDTADTNSQKTDYPFELYESFLVNSSSSVIKKLNNNPIDEKYYTQYKNAKSEYDEKKILVKWIDAYKKEFQNAKALLKKSVNENKNNETSSDLIKSIDKYTDACEDYANSTGDLAYSFEEFNLGKGTNHSYDLILNSLQINRNSTLKLIECIYLMNNNYSFMDVKDNR